MIDREALFDDFECAWRSGSPPEVEQFLPGEANPDERQLLLSELVHIDLEYRLKAGEAVRVESYLSRFPGLVGDRAAVVGLLRWEYQLRRRSEPRLSLAEYAVRFPQYAEEFGQETAHSTVFCPDGGPALPGSPSADRLDPIAVGGRYRVVRPHARGGLGEILVAEDETLRREVALKLLQPTQADLPDRKRRFLREAEVTSQLEHPGVVPVYGLGQASDGRPVYAMRFIRGETLRAAATRFHGATPARERVVAFRQLVSRFLHVCNTIAYAHSRGVIHRDLKPDNVMLGPYGETLVVDWGLAKCVPPDSFGPPDEDDTLPPGTFPPPPDPDATQLGTVAGTPAYMSPEQAAGRWDRVGPASDVYGLGATLFYLLTGRAPADGSLEEILRCVQQGKLPSPLAINPRAPAALAAVCRKAMARDPGQRYATALDLAQDVERWLADEPVGAWREPRRLAVRRWVTRHFTLVMTALVTLSATAVIAGVSAWLVAARDREREERKLAQFRSERDRERLDQADRDNYFHRIGAADQAWWRGQPGRAAELLGLCKEGLRHWEWHHLSRRNEASRLTLQGHKEAVWRVAYSPDGRWLASAGLDGLVKLWDPDTGKEGLLLGKASGPVWGLAFHPNGQWLASGGAGPTVRLWDVVTGEPKADLPHLGWEVYGLAFHPGGRFLAAACVPVSVVKPLVPPGVIKVWDLETGREALLLQGHAGGTLGVAFRSDGAQLASSGGEGTVQLWEVGPALEAVSRGEPARMPDPVTLRGHRAPVPSVAYSPDGRQLASASRDFTVRLWDPRKGRELRTLYGHRNDAWGVAYSPDGTRLATSGDDQAVCIWDTSLGRCLFVLRGHGQGIASVAYHPGGDALASASDDRTVKVWQVARRKAWLPLCGHQAAAYGVAFAPAGDRLGSSGDDAKVIVWDSSTGQVMKKLRGPAPSACVVMARDGRIASGHDDGSIVLWDAAGRKRQVLRGHQDRVWALALDPAGRLLASGSWDGTVRLWNLDTGKGEQVLRGHEGKVWAVAWQPTGEYLASGGDDKVVRLWDPVSGKLVKSLPGHLTRVTALAYSPDGRRLAVGTGTATRILFDEPGEIKVWEVERGEERFTLRGHIGSITGLAYHPLGKRLVSGGTGGMVKVWEAETGRDLLTLRGHQGPVHALAFSPTGERLASAGRDGLVLVWDGRPE